jgi:hypothetical protein
LNMREIDGRDRAYKLDSAPPPDAGDPLPIVLAKDGAVILSYVAGRELTVVATFPFCRRHSFEAKKPSEHPLAGRGLEDHGAFEVKGAAKEGKHFIFCFGASIFECVSSDVGIELIREDDDTVKLMAKRLYK